MYLFTIITAVMVQIAAAIPSYTTMGYTTEKRDLGTGCPYTLDQYGTAAMQFHTTMQQQQTAIQAQVQATATAIATNGVAIASANAVGGAAAAPVVDPSVYWAQWQNWNTNLASYGNVFNYYNAMIALQQNLALQNQAIWNNIAAANQQAAAHANALYLQTATQNALTTFNSAACQINTAYGAQLRWNSVSGTSWNC
ncbi:hypothetical protein BDEG_21645 [Batrachochytrium dendrobatidis JEL423]|uniref:Uncharacterized protein n=1 Tax=Batrachochytrium dendrobatidis (strain JEL423) TaxID=403673 RepID=A0A177WCX8_BATDL|nr:hypothetical protein BDEG_21645 [Batrachochytrium dendrobatidis JEL423]